MKPLSSSVAVALIVHQVSSQWITGTWVTGYWDCCKPSCSWSNKGNVNRPVAACDKITGLRLSNTGAVSVCLGGVSASCIDNQPFLVNNGLSMGFAAAAVGGKSGLAGDANCGQCYELQFVNQQHTDANGWPWGGAHPDLVGKIHVVQVTNIGHDVHGDHSFDLQIPGAGQGIFTSGCTAQFPGYSSGDFDCGNTHGGCSSVSGCSRLPASLQSSCEWRFTWFKWLVSNGKTNNPYVRFQRVKCPTQLTNITGTVPTDDDNYPHYTGFATTSAVATTTQAIATTTAASTAVATTIAVATTTHGFTTTVAATTSCAVGDAVKAVWVGNGRSYPATIASVNSDTTITVNWDDGDTSHRVVAAANVNKNGKQCTVTTVITTTVAMTTQAPTTTAATTSCTLGDAVTAVWAGNGWSYPATVASVNSDATITVNWDDGDTSHRVVAAQNVYKNGKPCDVASVRTTTVAVTTRSPTTATAATSCAVGHAVTAVWAGNGLSYPATVASVNSDATITVNWDDGDTSHRVVAAQNVYKNGKPCDVASVRTTTVAVTTRSPTTATAATSCAVGNAVTAVWAGNGLTYSAIVASINSDATITVNWDDGDTSHRVVPAQSVFKNGQACVAAARLVQSIVNTIAHRSKAKRAIVDIFVSNYAWIIVLTLSVLVGFFCVILVRRSSNRHHYLHDGFIPIAKSSPSSPL